MSNFDTDNTLLMEMLGKGGGQEVFTTVAQTGKNWFCVYFPVESVIATITSTATGASALNAQTMAAGSSIFLPISSITLTSGIGIGYLDH